jgi:glycosyltransferase involved in cell wall biosynthesis
LCFKHHSSPCFNIEFYIKNLLLSLSTQCGKNTELIFINDGSSDNTLSVINSNLSLLSAYMTVHVITTVNQGQFLARLEGLKYSRGEYIAFVDGDDEVLPEYTVTVESSILANPTSDLFVFDFIRQDKFGFNHPLSSYSNATLVKVLTRPDLPLSLFVQSSWFLWSRVYRTELLQRLPISPLRKLVYEDVFLVPQIHFRSKNTVYIEQPIILYKERLGSTTDMYSLNHVRSLVFICEYYVINKSLVSRYMSPFLVSGCVNTLLFISVQTRGSLITLPDILVLIGKFRIGLLWVLLLRPKLLLSLYCPIFVHWWYMRQRLI